MATDKIVVNGIRARISLATGLLSGARERWPILYISPATDYINYERTSYETDQMPRWFLRSFINQPSIIARGDRKSAVKYRPDVTRPATDNYRERWISIVGVSMKYRGERLPRNCGK